MSDNQPMPSPEAERVRELLLAAFRYREPGGVVVQLAEGAAILAVAIESVYRPTHDQEQPTDG